MRCVTVLGIALLLILAASFGVPAQGAEQGPTFQQQLEEWLPGMGAEKIPDRRDSQQKLQNLVFQLGTPGREAELTAACKVMAEKLGPDTAKTARIWLLKQLEFSGGAECVEAVTKLLGDNDPQIRECARRALQNNPAKEANGKLLAALAAARDAKWKLALANSLGYRGDPASAGALAKLLAEKDEGATAAAANALGKIGGPQAVAALKAAEAKASGKLQICIADAYLRCADKLLKEGKRSEAAAIYQEMSKPEKPKVIRMAATQGLLKTAGK